jgi:transposase
MIATPVGIDLECIQCAWSGYARQGGAEEDRLARQAARTVPCFIGMEACSGAHRGARQLRTLGHDARIVAPRFVVSYCKSGKNDGNDTEAISKAVP